jgi:MICOS complex subunit MIC19
VNHLSDLLSSPETSPERQTTLDSHIQSRIQAEIQHLRQEGDAVRKEIEHALEKENLDREKAMAGETSEEAGSGAVKSSAALMGDLEEIQKKVDRFQTRWDLGDLPTVKASGAAVISCYRCISFQCPLNHITYLSLRSNPQKALDCWREVNAFRASIANVEQARQNLSSSLMFSHTTLGILQFTALDIVAIKSMVIRSST